MSPHRDLLHDVLRVGLEERFPDNPTCLQCGQKLKKDVAVSEENFGRVILRVCHFGASFPSQILTSLQCINTAAHAKGHVVNIYPPNALPMSAQQMALCRLVQRDMKAADGRAYRAAVKARKVC